MAAVRCPTIVGRRAELTALRSSLAGARLARGSTVVLSGRPGIGKSRLAREAAAAARAWQVPVLVGRAVEAGAGTAFRPLAEALLGGLRRRPEPDDPALAPFRPALGRLVPQWRDAEPADDSLVVLGKRCCGCSRRSPPTPGCCSSSRTCTGRTRRPSRCSSTSPTTWQGSGCCSS
ncbi:AAA family ATPase [Pseudonocardia benzenivorans]|uniref:AAA family ATPase n=1 Tax=Pseudonocardia benzenivorans TaxID=228005 RepID=A0ABW3VEA5_9PSEU